MTGDNAPIMVKDRDLDKTSGGGIGANHRSDRVDRHKVANVNRWCDPRHPT